MFLGIVSLIGVPSFKVMEVLKVIVISYNILQTPEAQRAAEEGVGVLRFNYFAFGPLALLFSL